MYEWDEQKNASNKMKHGLRFEDVLGAFYDDYAITKADPKIDGLP